MKSWFSWWFSHCLLKIRFSSIQLSCRRSINIGIHLLNKFLQNYVFVFLLLALSCIQHVFYKDICLLAWFVSFGDPLIMLILKCKTWGRSSSGLLLLATKNSLHNSNYTLPTSYIQFYVWPISRITIIHRRCAPL